MTQKPSFRRELRLIIAGGRDFDDFSLMQQTLFNLFDKYRWRAKTDVITIISGCAKGADTLGIRYANMHHYRVKKFPQIGIPTENVPGLSGINRWLILQLTSAIAVYWWRFGTARAAALRI